MPVFSDPNNPPFTMFFNARMINHLKQMILLQTEPLQDIELKNICIFVQFPRVSSKTLIKG